MSLMQGVVSKLSHLSVNDSMDRLAQFLKKSGFNIYARIDQQDELKKVGLSILPLEYLLFGNPANGGHLMIENPIVALDLPLKIIAYEDREGKVWLVFNELDYIRKKYHLQQAAVPGPNLADLVDAALNSQ